MSTEDSIGVGREHRWATLRAQQQQLEADGCKKFVDLGKIGREELVALVRERTVIKAVYAFLLARQGDAVHMVEDYVRFAERLAKLPRSCSAIVKDVGTGLVADTPGTRRAMAALVKSQVAKHRQGLASAENGKQGGQEKEFTETEWLKFEAIWLNVRKYPTWDHAQDAFDRINDEFTVWRAHLKWGPRKFGVKATER